MRRYLFISLILLPSFGFALLSQGLPFFSSYSISDPRPTLFQVNSLPRDAGQHSISIPFRFPAELELGRALNQQIPRQAYDPISQVQIFSPVLPFGTSLPYRNPEGVFDITSRSASYNMLSYQPNVTYISYRRGISFDMGLSFGLSLNQGGLAYVDVGESKLRVKYTLNKNIFSFVKNSRWELFIQLSELHRFEGDSISRQFNTALKVQDPARSNFVGRQIYVSPGISISNSNLVFEGMVKVPINAREANRTLDDLWSPEVQGNLGLKYLFPVKAQSN
jgi:hypothetical protein